VGAKGTFGREGLGCHASCWKTGKSTGNQGNLSVEADTKHLKKTTAFFCSPTHVIFQSFSLCHALSSSLKTLRPKEAWAAAASACGSLETATSTCKALGREEGQGMHRAQEWNHS